MAIDYTGEHGGQLALAFAAGCMFAFAAMAGLGKFLWGLLGGAKDTRIKELEESLAAEKQRCAQMEERLVARIQNLEGIVLMVSPQHIQPQVKREIEVHREIEQEARRRDVDGGDDDA